MSVFLDVPRSQWVAENEHAFAIRDGFPVSPGHILVITKEVVPDWFSANASQRAAIMDLVERVKLLLDAERRPDGFNVGFNAGAAGGQTVSHLHVHVIPRFLGDMDDPSGGVRYAIPTRGNYKRKLRALSSGGTDDPFAKHIFPLFETASEIAIVAAFVQETGLDVIEPHVFSAVRRGAAVRILTGDYLDITQATALETLLDWEVSTDRNEKEPSGTLEARIIEVEKLPPRTRAFHPKAWRFEGAKFGIAFVGSSNLSRSALTSGIEWNLRVDRVRDGEAYAEVKAAFEGLWSSARELDSAWVAKYADQLPPGETEAEQLVEPPEKHEVQVEALERLRAARDAGRRRALVVLATGLGKTWLAAFDHQQLCEELGVLPRVLFLAHRKELLVQAAKTYRRAMRKNGHRNATVTWCLGDQLDLGGTVVMGSVAKLAQDSSLTELEKEHFDYVVVDEVHHASAQSYRDILDTLENCEAPPRFILGLTATPQRADSADILGLFEDHTAYSAGIDRGVAIKRLVPFHYFGVKDDIDYENIPWRNRRFSADELANLAQTEARMESLWRAWKSHAGTRSLVFCCSVKHALFVRNWLRTQGIKVNAVFSDPESDAREESLEQLARGELDAVCSVDVFNEGVDVPSVDRVVMLRPTESNVIFMQQLGRGLRAVEGKTGVTVIDFVGNHRIFVDRLRALFSLAGRGDRDVRELIDEAGPVELPSGCSVELELEAKDLLSEFMQRSGADEIEDVYRELRDERGKRPTAVELERMGYPPARLREKFGSWFEFVERMGDLSAVHRRTLDSHKAFLHEVEITEMTKSFKMVTLWAMVDAHRLRAGIPLAELARTSHVILRRSPELLSDIENEAHRGELAGAAIRGWKTYWDKNPVNAWVTPKANRRSWFGVKNDVFGLALPPEVENEQALEEMLIEIVELRLAQYRARKEVAQATSESFSCRVIWNKRDPLLKLPSRAVLDVPLGETTVRVDGAVWVFNFVQLACNVAHRAGVRVNELPDLLRQWFGPTAGRPGTAFDVRFVRSPNGWWCEPINRNNLIDLSSRRRIVAYPSLQAAAGHGTGGRADLVPDEVILPAPKVDPNHFAIRVSGNSMDGGKSPMRNGDWAILKLARSSPAGELQTGSCLFKLAISFI
ncbi:MAG: DEAD/DEAH box helicase family protein [Archangium sp.]